MRRSVRAISRIMLVAFIGVAIFSSVGCGKKMPPTPPKAKSPAHQHALNNQERS